MTTMLFIHDHGIRGALYRGEKRVMFQISEGSSLFDAEWSPEQFDTIFNEIGPKSRRCRPKNRCGLGGGTTNLNFLKTSLFWYWRCIFSLLRYPTRCKISSKIQFWKLEEISTKRFHENDVFGQNYAWGRFFRFIAKFQLFAVFKFTDVEITVSQACSRNLSILSVIVCPQR